MKPGDVIFAKKRRSEIIGRGVVTGEYVYDEEWTHFPHIRKVDRTHVGNWNIDRTLAALPSWVWVEVSSPPAMRSIRSW